jgi:hypothetical protein
MSRSRNLADLLSSSGDVLLAHLDNTTSVTVNDTLTSTSTTEALSANQGKTLMDGKPDNSRLLTDVPSSAVFTDTVYTHPNHSGDVVSSADGAMTIQAGAVESAMLAATGTASGTTFLRGDDSWVTPTDTTYSVGDGGLTTKDFTTTLKDKLDGVAASANNYSKPSTEPISYVSGLQSALDAKVDDTQVGTGANKIVQLNASGELPAVSAANLTDLPSTGGSAYFTDIGSYFTTI